MDQRKEYRNKSKHYEYDESFLLFFEIGEFNQPYPFTLEIELSLLKYFEEDISLERIADVERSIIYLHSRKHQ